MNIELVKYSGFPDAGVLYPRNKCKYHWHTKDIRVQAAIHGLESYDPELNIFKVFDAVDPDITPFMIIRFERKSEHHDTFHWHIVTDGDVFWFGDHVRQSVAGKTLTIELSSPKINEKLMDICKEDIHEIMHDYESHVNFTSFGG